MIGKSEQDPELTVPGNTFDEPEFTEEELRAAVKSVGQAARAEAFGAGRPVFFIKNNVLVALYQDGTEEVVESLSPRT